MKNLSRYALPAAIVVAVILRFWALGHQSFWYDEWDTAIEAKLSFGHMWDRLGPVELTPPFYFIVTWLWAIPFGTGEFALRSVSAIAGVATVPVLYLATKELVSRRAGLIVAWLAAVNPVLVWYSQEARSYSLMIFFTALAFLLFVRAMKGNVRALYGWGVVSALAIATHYLAAAPLIPEAVWLILRSEISRKRLALAMAPVVIVGAALLPLLHEQTGHGGWIGNLPLRGRALGVPQDMAVGFYAPFKVLPRLVLVGLGAAVVFAIRRGDEQERRGLALAGGIGLIGAAILVLPVITGNDYITTRNLLALWVPFGIAAGIALGVKRSGWVGPAATAALAVLSIGLVAWVVRDPNLQRPDWRDLAHAVQPPTGPRLFAALRLRSYNARPLELYLPNATPLKKGEPVTASEVVLVRMKKIPSKAVGTCFWGAMCNGNAGGFPFNPPPHFALVQSGSTERFVFELYRAPHPVLLPERSLRSQFLQLPAG